MMRNKAIYILKTLTAGIIFSFGLMPWARGDIYINVMAVNGADASKNSTVKFDLPGELAAADILDTNGLQLDYSVDDADYYVHGDVALKPKETKTFRIHIKDKWLVTPDQVGLIKKQIEEGYSTLGKVHDAQKAEILKTRLMTKIDYIVNLQSANVDSIEKRIDGYRTYTKEIKRIQNDALSVDYWRSDPGQTQQPKIIHLTIEVENPAQVVKHFKHKDYLPQEVKIEDVIEDQGFDVRFDMAKQLPFLFKEEDLSPGQKKRYSVGILDIWTIKQIKIDYLRSRAKYVFDYLKDSKYEESTKFLMDRISGYLKDIETSQAVEHPILEHISAYRINQKTYEYAQKDVETLEKLLAVFREDLEKSKVENVLQKVQALKSVSDVSKVMYNKKFEASTAWSFIGWVLLFVGFLTLVNFVIWLVRSKDKKIKSEPPPQQAGKP
ncbi:MAG: hypothetical protein HQL14_07950 [Candidatus Omnitrophica bacterium]|nr:hypothetical protein [Candidatus Omnitrophota bacterium]